MKLIRLNKGVIKSGCIVKVLPMLCGLVLCANFSAIALTDALRFKLTNMSNAYSDETAIRFIAGATPGFNGSYDAYKLFSYNTNAPSLFTQSAQGTLLSINAYPALTRDYSFELFAWTNLSDSFELSVEVLGQFQSTTKIILEDLETGSFYDVLGNLPIVLFIESNEDSIARFKVHFSRPSLVMADTICFGSKDGNILIEDAGNKNYTLLIADSNGDTVEFVSTVNEAYMVENLGYGNYMIVCKSSYNVIDTHLVTIKTHPRIELKASITHCSNSFDNNGAIHVEITSHQTQLDFTWSDGTKEMVRFDLSPGLYSLLAADTYQCQFIDSFYVKALNGTYPDSPEAQSNLLNEIDSSDILGYEVLASYTTPLVRLYPNPAKNFINVEIHQFDQPVSLQIIDMSGAVVAIRNIGLTGQIQLSTASMPDGCYVAKCICGDQVLTERFVVSR